MVMAFEDNPDSSISLLIQKAYTETNNVQLVFSKGNTHMSKVISKLDRNEVAIVFIDVVPDKIETVIEYNKCMTIVNEESLSNVYILAIPCIEYYVIKAFFDKSLIEVNCVLNGLDYSKVVKNSRSYSLSQKDFEKFCKSVIDNYRSCFKENGQFYIEDCICKNGKLTSDCKEYKLELKAYNLVSGLPAYWEMGTYENDDTKKYNLRDTVIKCRNNYYTLAQRYIEYGIVQDIYELTEYML